MNDAIEFEPAQNENVTSDSLQLIPDLKLARTVFLSEMDLETDASDFSNSLSNSALKILPHVSAVPTKCHYTVQTTRSEECEI